MTGTRATARPGHQAAAVAPRTATRTTIASSGQGRLSGSMRWSNRGLERRDDREPERETEDRSEHRADRADDGAVRQQHESQVLLCRADRGEHAELAEPSLRDDGEACGGNERGQEQEDGGHGEHRQGAGTLAVPARAADPTRRTGRRCSMRVKKRSIDRRGRVDQNRDGSGAPADAGETRANSSVRSTWVLDDADDGPATAVEGQRIPDLEREEVGHTVGDGDLPGTHRVAAPAECEQRAPVRAARVLGAELHLLDAAGDDERAVADHLGRPEPLPGGVETRLERSWTGCRRT